jgi:hypothetical protein
MFKLVFAVVLSLFVSNGFAAPSNKYPVLTETQYGKIQFGQSLKKVEASVGEKAKVEEDPAEGCGYVSFASYPNIIFMVENGKVVRGDTESSLVSTKYGISIGAKRADVKKVPKVVETRHEYDENGHYLTVTTPNRKNAIVFEESEGVVTYIRAGVLPAAGYIEGCQ